MLRQTSPTDWAGVIVHHPPVAGALNPACSAHLFIQCNDSGGTFIRGLCSHTGLAPVHGNHVRRRDRVPTAPGLTQRKHMRTSALRISLFLDTGRPHTC